MHYVYLTLGLCLLVGGAEVLVRGASGLALRLGVSPILIGLTVVAYGTSSPELAISLGAIGSDQPDLVIGNAVGSNTFNILFILGLTGLIMPLIVQQRIVRLEVPVMIVTCLLLWGMCLDGDIDRVDSAILLTGLLAYTVFVIRQGRNESSRVRQEYNDAYGKAEPVKPRQLIMGVLIVAGLGLTIIGARLMVTSSVSIARGLGISELTIGLTIVAAGTSLPEVAASLVAAIKGQRDIAIGNVIGSNIFNIFGILGVSGVVSQKPIAVPPLAMSFDIPVMVGASLICLPVLFTGYAVSRIEALCLLAAYVGYLYILMT